MRNVVRIAIAASLSLACLACTKPEPPDKEQPPEPQAAIDAEATELRDAVREPIERAEAVEDAVLEAAEKQREAVEAAAGG